MYFNVGVRLGSTTEIKDVLEDLIKEARSLILLFVHSFCLLDNIN